MCSVNPVKGPFLHDLDNCSCFAGSSMDGNVHSVPPDLAKFSPLFVSWMGVELKLAHRLYTYEGGQN